MGSGVKPKPRMARGGFQATTSPPSTVWRSIPGTTGPCPATPPSTCWAVASTAASWCGRARAAPGRGPSRWDTKGGCTTTGSTLLPMARWVMARWASQARELVDGVSLWLGEPRGPSAGLISYCNEAQPVRHWKTLSSKQPTSSHQPYERPSVEDPSHGSASPWAGMVL